jgi:hypothetical protein
MRQDAREQRPWPRNAGFCGSMSESGDQNSPNTSGPSESGSGSSTSVCMYNGKGREWTVILGWVVGGDGCGLVS